MKRNSNGAKNQETGATLRALRRAARRALELGARTGTPVYVIKDQRIVDLTKQSTAAHKKPIKPRVAG
jgi:hypothetical protein